MTNSLLLQEWIDFCVSCSLADAVDCGGCSDGWNGLAMEAAARGRNSMWYDLTVRYSQLAACWRHSIPKLFHSSYRQHPLYRYVRRPCTPRSRTVVGGGSIISLLPSAGW